MKIQTTNIAWCLTGVPSTFHRGCLASTAKLGEAYQGLLIFLLRVCPHLGKAQCKTCDDQATDNFAN